jgi:hypothetical protein
MNKTRKRLNLCSETLHRLDRRELATVGGAVTSQPPVFIGGCNSATCATCADCGGGGGTAETCVHSATQFICTN